MWYVLPNKLKFWKIEIGERDEILNINFNFEFLLVFGILIKNFCIIP